jgi:hypothetical protein
MPNLLRQVSGLSSSVCIFFQSMLLTMLNTSEFNWMYFIFRKCSAKASFGKAFVLRLPLSYQPTHQSFYTSSPEDPYLSQYPDLS